MPESLDRLRDADPLAYLEAPDAPPPELLGAIVATRPETRHRRPPRIAVAVAGVAAAAALVAVAAPSSSQLSLAQRAYAATAPDDAVVYTVSTVTDPGHDSVTHVRQWQRGDRMHNVIDSTQSGRSERFEHDQQGTTFRTLFDDGKVQSIDENDPGWKGDEGKEGFAQNVQTIVDRFRKAIASATDAGETTFNGRPAHAYKAEDVTYYVDPQTALPLGSEMTYTEYAVKVDPATGKPAPGEPTRHHTVVETVDHFERMPATAANLALLDAPDIDAAQR